MGICYLFLGVALSSAWLSYYLHLDRFLLFLLILPGWFLPQERVHAGMENTHSVLFQLASYGWARRWGSLTASCRQLSEFGKFYLVGCWQKLSPWIPVNFSGWFPEESQASTGPHSSLWTFSELCSMETSFWFPLFVFTYWRYTGYSVDYVTLLKKFKSQDISMYTYFLMSYLCMAASSRCNLKILSLIL